MAKRNHNIKQSLLARKEELLNELKYYEKRIDEAKTKRNSSFHDDSSDSEQELTVHIEPSLVELKLKQSMLKTCVYATQELAGVEILQSETNIVSETVFEREPSVKEEGTWREVTVECRVDLVPFSVNFYVHQPKRQFSPLLYKNLQVNPVKSAHERELSVSVLNTVKTPSDAVEVLRNYAKAHRSRRSTLARLAEKYGHTLFMEPLSEGGYILKCADILEISWILQNKWSPIAPFQHKMKFDLEYMDESYIKTITQIHRQLSDPSVETDERTLLLSKIINICLQANKQTDRTKNELNIDRSKDIKDKDSEIMAPPKLIPKKNKKRVSDDHISAKRAKVDNDKENSCDNNNGGNNLKSNFNSDLKNVKQVDKNKTKINGNKSKMISKDTEKVDNTQSSNRKPDKNNQLKANEQKNKENKNKTDNKEVLNIKNVVNNKATSKSDLKSINKESLKKKTDKNNQPKTNEQNINKTTETDKGEQINKKIIEKDNLISNSNNESRSSNKILNKNNEKDKVDLKQKKRKIDEKKTKTVNKDNLDKDNPNKEGNKNADKLSTKTDGNKKEKKDDIKSINDLKYKNNLIPNKELNKNKINTDKNKPKTNINNENKSKTQMKSIKDSKTKTNVIQNKEISRNKIENKRKISGNKFEIDRNKIKQTNLTNNSTLSNKEKNKIVSKIPKRIQSMELKKNIMRLSPRFIKKPSVKP